MMDRGEPRQDEQTFFTVARVAEQLGVTVRTVRRYIEQGITGPAGTRIKLGARLIATADGQRAIIEPTRLLTAQELRQRVCDYFGCEQAELLTQKV